MENFVAFMKKVAYGLQSSGNFGTAHVYRSTLNAFTAFIGCNHLPFRKVTPDLVKHFETHLRGRGCSWNTVSTYMRTLRAVYNRAVDLNSAIYVPHLFKHVYTGTRTDKKRALEKNDMAMFIKKCPESSLVTGDMLKAQGLFTLMFLLRGLPFVDLAYLKKSDLTGNVITYRRRKTGRLLVVTLVPEAMALVKKYMNNDPASPYLFTFLTSPEGTEEAYREYQLALRHFNNQLVLLQRVLGMESGISSYTARHTWATMAYYCEVHPGIISEAMGHSSITVTETYLKPFKNKKIDEANQKIISFLKKSERVLMS